MAEEPVSIVEDDDRLGMTPEEWAWFQAHTR
jgi:hypothetical protein